MRHVHLIGIGGSGLSAIARVLLERGETVSGSDRILSPLAKSLQLAGARVYLGHQADHIQGAQIVVRSSAVADDNVEVLAARAAGIPVLKRVDYLGELLSGHRCIAVAGTHGKTTTTAMLAWILMELGEDPSFIIGGIPLNLGTNARAGRGEYFVIEADEYDRMFLGLNPTIAVVTNVEHDHPDCYPTAQDFHQAFREFVAQILPDGILLACEDDPGSSKLLRQALEDGQSAYGYGLASAPNDRSKDYYSEGLTPNEYGGLRFAVYRRRKHIVDLSLRVPGYHNVRNALAALGAADLLGLPMPETAEALESFLGTGRRFDIRGSVKGVTVIDDYAHHPTEIKATLAAARSRYPGNPIWAIWQPHTFSRTRALHSDFITAFYDADHVMVTEVYAARETTPADGFSSSQIVAAMHHPKAHYVQDLNTAVNELVDQLEPDAVLLVLSAGDADQISSRVLEALQARG